MPYTPDEKKYLRTLRTFQWVYLAIGLNFLLPAVSYIWAPALAIQTLNDVNQLLGGGPWPVEKGAVWHMLAVGNVMTLGVTCLFIMADVERCFAALPPLIFLKMFSALYSLHLGVVNDLPAFLAVFVLDATTSVLLLIFAVRARRAYRSLPAHVRPVPLWIHVLLIRPSLIRERLTAAKQLGIDEVGCSVEQIGHGVVRMVHRLVFRSETVGTSTDPIRDTLRARLLAWRALRLPFLLAEGAVAPFDLSGLLSSKERIIRHLLAAHHDDLQLVYDLELLACHPEALRELRLRTREVVNGLDPRADWLRDLVVYEGYHERLLRLTEASLAGQLPSPDDPDMSLRAFFRWCGTHQPGPQNAL